MNLEDLYKRLEVHRTYLLELEREYKGTEKTQSYYKFKDKYLAAIEDYENRITLYGSGISILAVKGEGYIDNVLVEAICLYTGINTYEAGKLFLLDNPNFTITSQKHITSRHTIYRSVNKGK